MKLTRGKIEKASNMKEKRNNKISASSHKILFSFNSFGLRIQTRLESSAERKTRKVYVHTIEEFINAKLIISVLFAFTFGIVFGFVSSLFIAARALPFAERRLPNMQ